MSVITSKSTMLSILKVPSGSPRSSLHRVRFQLPKDIKKIFLDFTSGCNTRDYENLVCTIRDSEISDNDLMQLIKGARDCTSLLNYDLRLFVQAFVLIRWTHRSGDVVRSYQEFIMDLVTAHSCHIKLVIDQFVKLFLNVEESDWVNNQPNEILSKQFNSIHYVLECILTTLPLSDNLLMDSLKHYFPYVNAPTQKQVAYVHNLLKIIQYQSGLRLNILELIIDKMILLDVQSPKEEILRYEESQDDLLYDMEVSEIDQHNSVSIRHPGASALDCMMEMIFEFIKQECFVDGKLNESKCHRLFSDLMIIFEYLILPTHACHHVQYIMFYMCSFCSTVAQEFLKFLWRQVVTPSVSPVIRQMSVAYLSSFLARADYLSLGFLKNYLQKLSEWVHNYLARNDSTSGFHVDFKKHFVFYSVCQALFYLIAFMHKNLVNSAIKLKFLQTLNLPKIISCKLNPLKFCLPSIVENFAAVTRTYQLAYCYTIIENNARVSLPIMNKEGQLLINPVVDVYFPFDPSVLLRTNKYVHPLYREYTSVVGEETKLSKAKKRLHSGTEDEDDFIAEESLEPNSSDGFPEIAGII